MNDKCKVINKKDICTKMDELGIRGWQSRTLSDKIAVFADDYNIKEEYFYSRWGSQKPKIEIKSEAKGLFFVLARTYDKDPFIKHIDYDRDKISNISILEYYGEVIKCIDEELDEDIKYTIKNSYQYLTMIQEYNSIIKLIDKLSELSSAINKISQKARADFFLEMYKQIDYMINLAYEYEQYKDENESNIYSSRNEETRAIAPYEQDIFNRFSIDSDFSILQIETDIKNKVQQKLIDEDKSYSNISEYLASKLRDILKNSKDDKYVNKNEKIKSDSIYGLKIDELKEISKVREELIKRVNNFSDEEYEQYKKNYKDELIRDINENISNIESEYDRVITIEEEYRNILEWIDDGSIIFRGITDGVKPKKYYQDYLNFIESIKKDKEEYKKCVEGIIDEPVVRSKYKR